MAKTKTESNYHNFIAQLDCIACGDSPVQVHHVRHFNGDLVTRNHWLVLPLCPECHMGQNGIHHNAKVFRMRHGDESTMIARLHEEIYGEVN